MIKKSGIILLVVLMSMFLLCSCNDDKKVSSYDGMSITDLMTYTVPEGYVEWEKTMTSPDGAVLGVDFAYEGAKAPCMDLEISSYDGQGLSSYMNSENVTLEKLIKDAKADNTADIKEISIDGAKGYLVSSSMMMLDEEEYMAEVLDAHFEKDGYVFSLMWMDYESEELSDEQREAFMELLNSIKFK